MLIKGRKNPLFTLWKVNLNKLEYFSAKDALCQDWLKLARWFLRRFLNFVNVFSLFLDSLPLEMGGAFHLNKIESPLAKDAYAAFAWNLPNGSGNESEKFTTTPTMTTTTTTDNGQILIRKAHLSLWHRWAKKVEIVQI